MEAFVPHSPGPLTEADLQRLYAYPDAPGPVIRFNFIAAADGAATAGGLTAGLGNAGDRRIFALLRELADVILVGAGTVRSEGYAGNLVGDDARARRGHRGLAPHPSVAVISGSLDLDPVGRFFAAPPVRPLILTCEAADPLRRRALEAVAEVVDCGTETLEVARLVSALGERGLMRVLCEGGPSVLGSFTAAQAVDELCLSVSPLLVGGEGPRISMGGRTGPAHALTLASLLHEDSALYARYVRAE